MSRQSPTNDSKKRLGQYLSRCGPNVNLKRVLGSGTDGDVWESNRDTAIKVLHYANGYFNERDTYLRLEEYGVTERIGMFRIPHMINHTDDLMIVEMEMMLKSPYIIDFAKVRLNSPPDFSEDVLSCQQEQGEEEFEHHWPEVVGLMHDLESFQIYYLDPRRGNITFPDMP